MLHTKLDAANFCAKYVADGRAATDSLVTTTLDEAQMILINEGDWKSTVQKIRVRVNNNSFALPRNVETILKAYHADDHHLSPSRVWSMGYELLDGGPGVIGAGANDHEWVDLIDLGDGWPMMFPIGNTARPLVAFSTGDDDSGKTIRVRGRDGGHAEISPDTPGEDLVIRRWKGGVEGTVDSGQIKATTNEFVEIDFIKKPVTTGYVSIFAYQSSDHAMWFLGKYHPNETQPSFRRYKLTGRTSVTTEDCLTLLVKLRYVPLVDDTDVLIIQNLPALRLMCQSIHSRNMGDTGDALAKQGDAVRMLDQQLKSSHPETNEFDVTMTTSFGDFPTAYSEQG